jgi:hypothetical protein
MESRSRLLPQIRKKLYIPLPNHKARERMLEIELGEFSNKSTAVALLRDITWKHCCGLKTWPVSAEVFQLNLFIIFGFYWKPLTKPWGKGHQGLCISMGCVWCLHVLSLSQLLLMKVASNFQAIMQLRQKLKTFNMCKTLDICCGCESARLPSSLPRSLDSYWRFSSQKWTCTFQRWAPLTQNI